MRIANAARIHNAASSRVLGEAFERLAPFAARPDLYKLNVTITSQSSVLSFLASLFSVAAAVVIALVAAQTTVVRPGEPRRCDGLFISSWIKSSREKLPLRFFFFSSVLVVVVRPLPPPTS